MRMYSIYLFFFTLFFTPFFRAADRWNGIVDQAKGVAEGFGYVRPSWRYSFRLWNDSAIPIYVIRLGQRTVMGCHFPEDIIDDSGRGTDGDPGILVLPGGNSSGAFNNCQLEFTIFMVRTNEGANKTFYSDETKRNAIEGAKISFLPGITNLIGAVMGSIVAFFKNQATLHENVIFEKAVTIDAAALIQNDANIYNYRAYTDSQGQTHIETIGYVAITRQFLGMVYNHTDASLQLTFLYNSKEYTVTLEPQSFNFLSSSRTANADPSPLLTLNKKNNSASADKPVNSDPKKTADVSQQKMGTDEIRPDEEVAKKKPAFLTIKNNSLAVGQIPISPFGLIPLSFSKDQEAQLKNGSSTIPLAQTFGTPFLYTYEIVQNGANFILGSHAFVSSSNLPIPKTARQRDVSPLTCLIWLQSIQQSADIALQAASGKSDKKTESSLYDSQPYIGKNESYWCAYRTKDFSCTTRIVPGQITTVQLLRPQIQEGDAKLFFAVTNSNDQVKVAQFFDRIVSGAIGKEFFKQIPTQLNVFDAAATLQFQKNSYATINDEAGSGIVAVMLGFDAFSPIGSTICTGVPGGFYYYTMSPASVSVQDCISSWTDFLDPKKLTEFNTVAEENRLKAYGAQQLSRWITLIETDKNQVIQEIQAATVLYGRRPSKLSDQPSPFKDDAVLFTVADFNESIQEIIKNLVDGQISFSNPLLIRTPVSFSPDRTEKPERWPSGV